MQGAWPCLGRGVSAQLLGLGLLWRVNLDCYH